MRVEPDAAVGGSALVARVDFGSCLLLDSGGALREAKARGSLMGRTKSLGNRIVVGDIAHWESVQGRAMVTGVEPRRNAFSRRAPGGRVLEQVVAANLDQVIVVASIVEPEFKSGFVDRVLCQAEHASIPACLVINKADLCGPERVREVIDDYARAGYAGFAVSAKSGDGLDALSLACRGRRSIFVGHSGVGKSTLLNALIPGLDLLAGGVNQKTGKGRHTTTAAWLLRPEPGLELIDTPGVRAFGLWGVGAADLDHAYAEFRPHLGACRFGDCTHDREPGCAVRDAVASGAIASRRLASYHKLRAELLDEEAR